MRTIANNPLLFVLVYTAVIVLSMALIVRGIASRIPGARVTSWFRNPIRNVEVGGLVGSAHLIGWAVDLAPVTPAIESAARAAFPVVVNEGDHIHAAVFRA